MSVRISPGRDVSRYVCIHLAPLFFRRKRAFGAHVNERAVLWMFVDKSTLWYDVSIPFVYSLLIALRVEKHVVIQCENTPRGRDAD